MRRGGSGSPATCCRCSSEPGFASRLQVSQVKQQALANAGPTDAKRPLLHRTAKAMIINTASHQVPLFGGSKPAANGDRPQTLGIAVTLPRNGQFLGRPTPRD